MTPLPGALGGRELVAWRIDQARFAPTWDTGEGAFQFGGRWNSKGVRAVYCSLDPATAILEVAVHRTFEALDTLPHVVTAVWISDPGLVHIVRPQAIPDPGWLAPGITEAAQQAFGDDLLRRHSFVAIPSVVSPSSWNLVFRSRSTDPGYVARSQDMLVLDRRLHNVR